MLRYNKLHEQPHPNILTVYGICTDAPSGKLLLVMELCEKGSVYDLLMRERPRVRDVI